MAATWTETMPQEGIEVNGQSPRSTLLEAVNGGETGRMSASRTRLRDTKCSGRGAWQRHGAARASLGPTRTALDSVVALTALPDGGFAVLGQQVGPDGRAAQELLSLKIEETSESQADPVAVARPAEGRPFWTGTALLPLERGYLVAWTEALHPRDRDPWEHVTGSYSVIRLRRWTRTERRIQHRRTERGIVLTSAAAMAPQVVQAKDVTYRASVEVPRTAAVRGFVCERLHDVGRPCGLSGYVADTFPTPYPFPSMRPPSPESRYPARAKKTSILQLPSC